MVSTFATTGRHDGSDDDDFGGEEGYGGDSAENDDLDGEDW